MLDRETKQSDLMLHNEKIFLQYEPCCANGLLNRGFQHLALRREKNGVETQYLKGAKYGFSPSVVYSFKVNEFNCQQQAQSQE